MAETESISKPKIKGILKNAESFDKDESQQRNQQSHGKEMKWDEMNILATYHPADKDYGHEKITDPPTPYNRQSLVDSDKSGDEGEVLDPQKLNDSLKKISKTKIAIVQDTPDDEDEGEEAEDENLTEEEKAKKLEFVRKRRLHYNEFQAAKLRAKMLEEEEEDEADDETETERNTKLNKLSSDNPDNCSVNSRDSTDL